ncbi:MAG: hypothetical protein ACJ71D_08450 [Nitrososphaera sp.]
MSKRLVLNSDTLELHHSIRWPQGDILVHAGDFNINDSLGKIGIFGNWLYNLPFSSIIIIAGNHEIMFQSNSRKSKKTLLLKHDKAH